MGTILQPHVKEGDFRRPSLYSAAAHIVLFLFFTFGLSLLPKPDPIVLGMGDAGGGQGDFVSVGLSGEIGGGEGMYKAPVTPRAETAPPEVAPKRVESEPEPEPNVFDVSTRKKPQQQTPQKAPAMTTRKQEQPKQAQPGQIQRQADAGKGARSGSAGSGGGFGTGRGVTVGSGTGEGEIDSWYIRQVEQRVGQNWLQTSLGQLDRKVRSVATFVVQPSGQISDIDLEESSGISSVDLAVRRAIQASNPLPRMPLELRGRTVRFKAVFEYPPGARD